MGIIAKKKNPGEQLLLKRFGGKGLRLQSLEMAYYLIGVILRTIKMGDFYFYFET